MRIRRVVALRGPNVWANFPVLEAWVDLGRFRDSPSDTLEGFSDRVIAWLPSLVEHRCGIGERGGFFQRLRSGTYLGHVLEHVTLELESLAGPPVGFGRARETSEPGVFKVVVRYAEESLGRACLSTAQALLMAAVDGHAFDLAGELKKLRELGEQVCLGPSSLAIIAAAKARYIPHLRLNSGSLVQLGYGRAQRRIWAAETDATGAVAESIAQDKELTRRLLKAAGVPVAEGRVVESPEEAWAAAEEIGLPVVVKPRDGNHGRGVSIGLSERENVVAAYGYAKQEGNGVVVERFVSGLDHRLLVVDGRVVAASRGDSEQVVGDGIHSVRDLVEEANQSPLRGTGWAEPLCLIALDEIAVACLAQQGLELDSLPSAGKTVILHRNGDTTTDETVGVHPDVAATAVLAAQTVGLNIAGIDLVATDIQRPLDEQGGAVLEVNACPALRLHLQPLRGKPQPVGEAIVESLFPTEQSGRIPIVAVTGTNGKSTVVKLVGAMLNADRRSTGIANSDGLWVSERGVADRCLSTGDAADALNARRLLLNPGVEAAVLEVSARSVLDEGLGFEHCQVAVVTNLGSGDHLGRTYVESLDLMTRVKRAPVDVVLPNGVAVLNADDPLVVDLGQACKGEVLWFGLDGKNPRMMEHGLAGGRTVCLQDDEVVLLAAGSRQGRVALSAIPLLGPARPKFQLENVLAAVAAGWALGLDQRAIQAGLSSVKDDTGLGRFIVLELAGRWVTFSLCRNLSALAATTDVLRARFPEGMRAVIYAARSDWRAEDALAQGQALGTAFDHVVLVRGSEPVSPRLVMLETELERGIALGGRARSTSRAPNLECALEEGWARLGPGEGLLVQVARPSEIPALHDRITCERPAPFRLQTYQATSVN
jgi:cyanophycin synthetase